MCTRYRRISASHSYEASSRLFSAGSKFARRYYTSDDDSERVSQCCMFMCVIGIGCHSLRAQLQDVTSLICTSWCWSVRWTQLCQQIARGCCSVMSASAKSQICDLIATLTLTVALLDHVHSDADLVDWRRIYFILTASFQHKSALCV